MTEDSDIDGVELDEDDVRILMETLKKRESDEAAILHDKIVGAVDKGFGKYRAVTLIPKTGDDEDEE